MFWLPLYFIIILLSFLSNFTLKKQKVMFLSCVLICCTYFWMGYLNGVDWVNYYAVYQNNDTLVDFISNYEIGFSSILFILKCTGFSFINMVFIFYLMVFIILYKGTLKISKIVPVNYCFLFSSIIFFNGLELFNDQLRQLAAFVFSIHALTALLNNNKKQFLLLSLIAVLFHYSAIIIVLVYPMINFKKKNVIAVGVLGTLCSALLILNTALIVTLFDAVGLGLLASRLNNYIGKFEPAFGILMIFDIVILCFYILYNFSSKIEQKIWNGVFISSCLHLVFYLFPILQRFNAYLYLFICILSAHYFCNITIRPSIQKFMFGIIAVPLCAAVFVRFYADPIRQHQSSGYLYSIMMDERTIDKQRDARCDYIGNVAETFCRK